MELTVLMILFKIALSGVVLAIAYYPWFFLREAFLDYHNPSRTMRLAAQLPLEAREREVKNFRRAMLFVGLVCAVVLSLLLTVLLWLWALPLSTVFQ